MAINRTITSINTKLTLIASNPWVNNNIADKVGLGSTASGFVSPLIGVPLSLEGLTSDSPFKFSSKSLVETVTSFEGTVYGGYLPDAHQVELEINFVAASSSLAILQSLAKVMQVQREALKFNGTMIIPSLGKNYNLNNGYLTQWQAITNHQKTLSAVPCKFIFESVDETVEV